MAVPASTGRIRRLSGLLALGFASAANALTYEAPLETAQWHVASSRFGCELTQPIPAFGDARFVHKAGMKEQFILTASAANTRVEEVRLAVEAPPWRPGGASAELGVVPLLTGHEVVRLHTETARRLLYELRRGYRTRIAKGGERAYEVVVSAVNFSAAYQDYLDCLQVLAPINHQQAKRSTVSFANGGAVLTDDATAWLDQLAMYVSVDGAVRRIYIDGHSDSQGRRSVNYALSEARAKAVGRYLAEAGVSPELIEVRFHGERYPVVPNTTAANRARNRRATIRIERQGDPARDLFSAPETSSEPVDSGAQEPVAVLEPDASVQ